MYIRFFQISKGECVREIEEGRLKETFTVHVRVLTLFTQKVDITFCFLVWKINTSTQGIHMTYNVNSFCLFRCLWRGVRSLTPKGKLPFSLKTILFFCFCPGQSCNSSFSIQNMQALSMCYLSFCDRFYPAL